MKTQFSYLTLSLLLTVAGCESNGASDDSESGGTTSHSGGGGGGGGERANGNQGGGGAAGSGTNGGGGTDGNGGGTTGTSKGGAQGTGGSGSGKGGSSGTAKGGSTGTAGTSGASSGGSTGAGGKGGIGGTVDGGTASDAKDSGSGGATTEGGSSDGGAARDAVPSEGCNQPRKLQDGNQQITSAGQSRTYYVKAPANYDSTHPYRVIFQYHWNYGSINAIVNPPDADKNTDRPFYGMGDLSGDTTIYVVPEGLENGWANTNDRDTKLTDDMYSAVTKGLCVDTSRVFTTGFSYGGAISLKLACTRPDKFRAALVYDTGTFLSGFSQAECTKPIAFFQSHGLDDHTFEYSMGLSILDIFTKLNNCKAQTPPTAPDNGHVCTSLEGCSDGHPIRFCNFGKGENNPKSGGPGGHYPSPKDPGQTTSWVPAEAWDFLTQF